MALFPFFMNMENSTGLIIGGGKHALEKIEKLLPYGPYLKVYTEAFVEEATPKRKDITEAIKEETVERVTLQRTAGIKKTVQNWETVIGEGSQDHGRIEMIPRAFQEDDLTPPPAFVIAATEYPEENHRISALCQARRIPVNVVDDPDWCTFVFPSLIQRGSLSIGISTAGASPATAVWLRKQVEQQIPDQTEQILDWLQSKRAEIQEAIPQSRQRFAFHHRLTGICMEQDRPLTEAEFQKLLEEARQE